LWFDLNQERIDQMLLLSIDIYGSNLIIRRMFSKNESMKDIKWCVRQDGSWRRINKDLVMMNHASKKSKRESWRRGIVYDEEGQVDVNSRNQTICEESYIIKCQSLLNQDMKWLRDQKWKLIIWCEVLQVTISKSQCWSKIKYSNSHKVKKKSIDKNQYCASSSWRNIFYTLSWV
jgi:hypothetical protein